MFSFSLVKCLSKVALLKDAELLPQKASICNFSDSCLMSDRAASECIAKLRLNH